MNPMSNRKTAAQAVALAVGSLAVGDAKQRERSMFLRVTHAESKLNDCGMLAAAFRVQASAVPEGNPLRVAVERMLDAFDQVLAR